MSRFNAIQPRVKYWAALRAFRTTFNWSWKQRSHMAAEIACASGQNKVTIIINAK